MDREVCLTNWFTVYLVDSWLRVKIIDQYCLQVLLVLSNSIPRKTLKILDDGRYARGYFIIGTSEAEQVL